MKLTIKELAVFGMLGGLMFGSKRLMESLPNIHLLAVFIVALTVVYGKKALYPLYTYVFIEGLFGGFNVWWLPYLYIWTALWAIAMLIPKNLPEKTKPFIYAFAASLHGFMFGLLYAPAQALIYGLSFKSAVAWWAIGLRYDAIHGVSNLILGFFLIYPLAKLLQRADRQLK